MTSLITVRRTLAALATGALALTALSACGDDPGETHAAGASAQEARAADLEPGDDVSPADFADLLADGFDQITTAHATVKAEFGTGSMSGEGDVDYRADTPATAMTITSPMLGGGAEARLVDGVMYLKIGQLSHDKFWKLDLDDPNSPFGSLGSQLDPKSAVELLEKGLESVTYVGEDRSLDHYRASVDPQALVDQLGKGMTSAAPSLPKSLDYDVWLDDQNRLNELTFTMGDAGSLDMTLSDWGTDVSIEAPPADQVTQMPGMFSSPSAPPQA